MKLISPSLTLLIVSCLLLCLLDQAQGTIAHLDESLIIHDTVALQRRQEASLSPNGDSGTTGSPSPDGSTDASPDSTSNTPSSSPSPQEETTTSADITSQTTSSTSPNTPTVQTSERPPQSTSYQTTPATVISTSAATTPHTTEHTERPSSSQAQAQKTTSSTNDAPSTMSSSPTPLDSNSATSPSSSPVESAVTSVSPTLVLGDMECASDPLAQQGGRCPSNHYCNAALKQCAVKLDNGGTCAADFQCASGYCIGMCTNRSTSNNSTQGLTGGQLAGITLGTIGGVLVALMGILVCYRRRKRRMAAEQSRAMHYMLEGGNGDDEMTDKSGGKAATRLSKYNFLAQVLDGQQRQQQRSSRFASSQQGLAYTDNDTESILDYQNEFYVSNSSVSHPPAPPLFNTHSVSSSSTTALRPRPITEDFNNDAASSLVRKPRPDSEAFSMEQRYPMTQGPSLATKTTTPRITQRDSMTDTILSSEQSSVMSQNRFTGQQHQHFMDINNLWDDALHHSVTSSTTPRQFQPAPVVSQDAWSQEDQASFSSIVPATPRYGHPTSPLPPLPSGPPPSSHPPSLF